MPSVSTPADDSSRSLATAAVATEFFERICLFQGGSNVAPSEALRQHGGGLSFNALGATTTVRNHTLANVVLEADSLFVFQDRQAIPETAYFEPANSPRHLPDDAEITQIPDAEDLILGYNNAHRGYQHWLTQCIPAIDWSLRQQRDRDVRLILPLLEPWQQDFLALLGYDRIPRLIPQPGTRYHLPRLEYFDFLRGTTSFEICLSMRDTARRISRAVPATGSTGKILYVTEVKPYYGSIGNEEAVIDLFRRHGVVIAEPGRLGTAERINLFRNADVVIGPTGQGLTDAVFCRPGALLWEWTPRHHQNASFNRLAQAAQLDYWGDIFETVFDPSKPGQWEIDLDLVSRRLSELSIRLRQPPAATEHPASPPIDGLMLRFESLGDNCEFGLVQRHAGAESLGLMRFNGIYTPAEFRLEKLIASLRRNFDGLGAPGTIEVFPDGIAGERELIVRESTYEFWYHTGIAEGLVEPAVQCDRETVRLGFLRRKLLEDLQTGDKAWVWRCPATTHRNQIQPLLDFLRSRGPNTLLWVVEADADHVAGSVEALEPDLIKGYVRRFAPYHNATDIDLPSWLIMCWRADQLLQATRSAPHPEPALERPSRPLSAMDYLASKPSAEPAAAVIAPSKPSILSRLLRWLGRH